jgi:ATP-binding cassette, subfamily B, bacterial
MLLQGLVLALPALTQVIVDRVLPLHLNSLLPVIGLSIVLLILTQVVASYLRALLLMYWRNHLDAQMMLGVFEHLLSLPFNFFQVRPSGDLLTRMGSIVMIRDTLTLQMLSIVLDTPLVLLYLGFLWWQNPLLAGLTLGFGLLQITLIWITHQQTHHLNQQNLITQSESQSYAVEAFAGITTIKASGAEDQVLTRWTSLFFKQLNVSLQTNHLAAITDTLMSMIRAFAPIILLWVGAIEVLNGHLSLGAMLALNAIAILFLTPLYSLVTSAQKLQLVGAHLERLGDILDTAPEQSPQQVQPAPLLTGNIEIRNVSFRYADDSSWILRKISFTVKPGQKIAIVGRSGSGKSTLAKLLLGLYPLTEGEIFYDQHPLSGLNYRSLRQQLGVVLQDSTLFQGSIRQNLTLNSSNTDLSTIIRAAQLAAIDADIQAMPMGYETPLSEGGGGLSGGQRQRLFLARVLINQPKILLLDEATSHLDTVCERIVEENLDRCGCTRIVIAHRLSTIQNADLILVMDQGQIIERGTHTELIARNGHYNELTQFSK